MNKTYTLKELAEIYMGSPMPESACTNTVRAGIQKVLDSIGYEFPKDEEREAFERWYKSAQIPQGETQAFAAWKAGREELRRTQMLAKEPPELVDKPLPAYGGVKTEPAWIPWAGGVCPLGDGVGKSD